MPFSCPVVWCINTSTIELQSFPVYWVHTFTAPHKCISGDQFFISITLTMFNLGGNFARKSSQIYPRPAVTATPKLLQIMFISLWKCSKTMSIIFIHFCTFTHFQHHSVKKLNFLITVKIIVDWDIKSLEQLLLLGCFALQSNKSCRNARRAQSAVQQMRNFWSLLNEFIWNFNTLCFVGCAMTVIHFVCIHDIGK